MELIEVKSDLAELAAVQKGCVLTIGNFDGVHLGHQQILNAAKQTATKNQTQLVVMTFEPHPLAVLNPHKKPDILTSLALKKHLLAEAGADCLLLVKSTPELLSLSSNEFVERFISKGIQPSIVVEGESFNFGSGRDGNVHTLQQMGQENGFLVSIIEAKEVQLSTGQTIKISSTLIRDMLKKGSVADTALALSRPYRLIGRIIPGRGKGKQLGFPTANMAPPDQLVPAEGVYAGYVKIADSEQEVCAAKAIVPAALSIGRTQTLGTDIPLLIEAHLLIDDVGELYDKWLAMDFIHRIRSQQKFDTEKQLSEQIANDCKTAKQILAKKHYQRLSDRNTNRSFMMSKKVLVAIADGTEELEAVTIIDVLRRAKADVTVASVDAQQVTASRGVKLVADAVISECVGNTYDLIALPGGMPGAEHLRDSKELIEMLKEQAASGRLYAAICASPAVALKPHGLLKDKKATCYPSLLSELDNAEQAKVVVDGNCITSQGPATALEFALKLVELLFDKQKSQEVAKAMLAIE